jgi:molecular chaperone GrpE
MAEPQERKQRNLEPRQEERGEAVEEKNNGREELAGQGEMPYKAPGASTSEEDSAERIDRLVRAVAEAENARRRAERTAAEARQYAIGDFARDLLIVADNLQRALSVAEAGGPGADKALVEGVRATDRLLKSAMERYGIQKIDSLGTPFDPKLHEAVMVIDDEAREPGTIVEVAEEGYMLNDRLLRPARVFVNNPNIRPAVNSRGQVPG